MVVMGSRVPSIGTPRSGVPAGVTRPLPQRRPDGAALLSARARTSASSAPECPRRGLLEARREAGRVQRAESPLHSHPGGVLLRPGTALRLPFAGACPSESAALQVRPGLCGRGRRLGRAGRESSGPLLRNLPRKHKRQ